MTDPSLPKTLLQLAGADLSPAGWDESALVLIDCQNEYVTGAVPLAGVEAALEECRTLLAAARAKGAPVIHIRHKGQPGGAFDWEQARGAICETVAALDGEAVIGKTLPNSFAGTELDATLEASGRKKLVVAGFMTHMCVSATVRSALDHGYFSTVVDAACATRDLPDGKGGVIAAADLHRAELAALADRFCVVAPAAQDIA